MAATRSPRLRDWTVPVLLAITLLALAVRLVGLGDRVAHFDEARVAHDALRYHKAGVWTFEPVVHGPFLPKVNDLVFGLLGASDFSARLVAAVSGALAPLAAWLFREHLRREEVVALAAVLALNPVLLYYSRFMRNDVPLAVVMLVAFGLLVRAYDTRRSWYLYGVGIAVAVGMSMKGNAILYPVAWAGALAVVGYLRFTAGDRVPGLDRVRDANEPRRELGRLLDHATPWIRDGLVAVALGLVVLTLMYTQRGPSFLSLGDVLRQPTLLPAYLDESIVDATRRTLDYWVFSGSTDTPYLSYLTHYLETLRAGALVVGIFAVIGVLVDHLADRRPRALVLFATAWGVASVVGYPIAADIKAPWLTVHAIVPLAIPAAVGLGLAIRTGLEAASTERWVDAALAALVLLAAAGLVVAPAYDQVYQHPTDDDNQLVQFAQPGGDWGDTTDRLRRSAESNDGVDVLFVGETYFMTNESDADHKPAAGGWYDRLPLPWYTEQADAATASVVDPADVEAAFEEDPPPVVIAAGEDSHLVDGYVDDYEHRRHLMRLWSEEADFYFARS
ncbi:MAG: flippase activity-associated protein Agl23 [Halobacteriales archaeon]